MPSGGSVRAVTVDDLADLAKLGLDQAVVMRAMAQDMAWLLEENGRVVAGTTAQLADGTVFLDSLCGDEAGCVVLIDHALAYARWSFAPAVTLLAPDSPSHLEKRGFVGLDAQRLPPSLLAASVSSHGKPQKVLMKRL